MGVVCGGDVKDSCDILPDNIFSKLLLESPCQTLTHCLAAKRIAKILNEFSQFKKDPNSCTYETMYQYINELNTLYTNRKLLNDYIHLVTEHQTNEDYEAIHNFLISEMNYKCDITTCNNLQRNQRDRCNDNNIIIQKQLYNTSDPKDVVTQHICDKIHCYFLHTFDLGYRLTENERKTVEIISDTDSDDDDILLATCIDNELRRRQEIIHSKQEQDNNNNNNRNNSDRWILNKNECISRRCFRILNDDPNDFKQEEVYSFGFSFRYGRWNQQNKWFVKPKYENFKCELTNNNTNQLTIDQFNGWLIKALHHLDSDYCKSIKCELQRLLTETYRKRINETDEEYAVGGEFLYHGIDHQITFESTMAYFDGPLSTSSEHEVPLIFEGNNGLVIEFHNLDQHQAAYFDCAWCSEYAYIWEEEIHCNNYYWVGKYLFEAVQFYGDKFSIHNTKVLYKGIHKIKSFDLIAPVFSSPILTTDNEMMARKFAGNQGCTYSLTPKYYGDIDNSKILDVKLFNKTIRMLKGTKAQLRSIRTLKPQNDLSPIILAMQYIEKILLQTEFDVHFYNTSDL
eukprot:38280_1